MKDFRLREWLSPSQLGEEVPPSRSLLQRCPQISSSPNWLPGHQPHLPSGPCCPVPVTFPLRATGITPNPPLRNCSGSFLSIG